MPHFAHSKYTDMFTIIVRTNKVKDLNEDFITKELCKGEAENYFKVQISSNFWQLEFMKIF